MTTESTHVSYEVFEGCCSRLYSDVSWDSKLEAMKAAKKAANSPDNKEVVDDSTEAESALLPVPDENIQVDGNGNGENQQVAVAAEPILIAIVPKKRSRGRPRAKLNDQPSWLPPQWKAFKRTRKNGRSAGHVDTYYVGPNGGQQFRSKREVFKYLGIIPDAEGDNQKQN